MLGTANVPKPVNIAPGTEGSSTGTKNPLGMPVAFLMSIGSLMKINYIRIKAIKSNQQLILLQLYYYLDSFLSNDLDYDIDDIHNL